MRAILALAVGAAAFGSSSSATSSEDLESIEATLDHVEKMVYNHTYTPSAPIGTTTLGHGVDPDDYSTLDDYQLPMRRRLEDGESLGVLGLGSGDLNLFERAGFVVPFDWECQTGTSGGVYPCPNGIPSTCRANTGGVSSVCAKCYCEVGSHTCCPYYSENNTYSEDGYWYGAECPSALLSGELVTDSAVNYCEVGDAVSALYDDGESYSANVTEVTGSDITVTYSDDDTSTYDLTESGNVVQTASGADCVTTCDSSTLDTEVWGNQWWNDPTSSTSTRPTSTAASAAVLGDIDLTLPIDHARLVEARYRHSNTRGGSQKPATASEVPSPKGEPAALKDARVKKARRRLGRRGSFISTVGSFSISGNSNRSGNDR
ncbi:hypothetical protein JL721_2878 [Aureococcus anophagefferens]|nr:hypothetical protein JL721_2878 [Aureococcus anophagefferens]